MKPAGTSSVPKPRVTWSASPNFSMRGSRIGRVILHYTTSRSVGGVVAWFQNPTSRVSAHYVIARAGDVVQMVNDAAKAWHAYGENDDSIGIEICAEKGDRLTNEQTVSLTALLKYLLSEYHLDEGDVTAHRFTESNKGRTDCPGDLWKDEEELRVWLEVALGNIKYDDTPKSNAKPYAPCPVPLPWSVTLAVSGKGRSGVTAGEAVYHLQCALIGLGYLAKPKNGELVGDVFNEHVEYAVERFQKDTGLVNDGIVGPKTRATIEATLRRARALKKNVVTLTYDKNAWHTGRWDGLRRLTLTVGHETFSVASGQPGRQRFRLATDPNSAPGSMEPIPQGWYDLEGAPEFVSGVNNYTGSWGEGLGPVWHGLRNAQKMRRGAFGLHLDAPGAAGSAGCIVFASVDDLARYVRAWHATRPDTLVVDWGL
jgi:N-acetylmuramoyl-L-alanine amidase/Putative peptidoglycan binding domain